MISSYIVAGEIISFLMGYESQGLSSTLMGYGICGDEDCHKTTMADYRIFARFLDAAGKGPRSVRPATKISVIS